MIAFQSVTASARTAEGMAEAIGIASITATHRKKFKRFIGLILSLGLRYLGKTSFPARRPSAEAVPGRGAVMGRAERAVIRSLLGCTLDGFFGQLDRPVAVAHLGVRARRQQPGQVVHALPRVEGARLVLPRRQRLFVKLHRLGVPL